MPSSRCSATTIGASVWGRPPAASRFSCTTAMPTTTFSNGELTPTTSSSFGPTPTGAPSASVPGTSWRFKTATPPYPTSAGGSTIGRSASETRRGACSTTASPSARMSSRAVVILRPTKSLSGSSPTMEAVAMAMPSICGTTFVTMTIAASGPIPPRPTPPSSCLSATTTIGASGGSTRTPTSYSFGPIRRAAPSAWVLALLSSCSPAISVLAISAGSLTVPSSVSETPLDACSTTFQKISSPRLLPGPVTMVRTKSGRGPTHLMSILRQITSTSSLGSSRRYGSPQIRTSASEFPVPAVARVCVWKAASVKAVTCRPGSAMASSSVSMLTPTDVPGGKGALVPISS
mmetsp:Transcript_1977/g.3306  ORF Transcript_1977/g.3306 Transcript_1977/m.3306 type:complete len:347 (-) Transcript_1977:439-1479(-)